MSQVHAHYLLPRLQGRHVHRQVCARARVRLDVGVFGAEKLLGAVYGDLLDIVHVFATAIPSHLLLEVNNG